MYLLNRTYGSHTYYYKPTQVMSPRFIHRNPRLYSLLTSAIYRLFDDLVTNAHYDPQIFRRLLPIIIHKDPIGFAFELESKKKFLIMHTARTTLTAKQMEEVKIPLNKTRTAVDLCRLPPHAFDRHNLDYCLNPTVEKSGIINNKSVILRLRTHSSPHFVLGGAIKTTNAPLLNTIESPTLSIEVAQEYLERNANLLKLIPSLTSTQSFLEVLNAQ